MVADDTKVYSIVTDDDDIFRMQQDIDNLIMGLEKSQLPLMLLNVQLYILGRQTAIIFILWLVVTSSKLVKRRTLGL